MPVSDLTNTTWVFNRTVPININTGYYLDFVSNNQQYSGLSLGYADLADINYSMTYTGLSPKIVYTYDFDDEIVDTWREGEEYRTITITGGTHATNSDLIAFLEANATQQTPPEPEPSGLNLTFLGSNQPIKYFVGSLEVSKMFLGSFKIYEKGTAEEATFELSDGKYLYVSNGDYFDAMAIPMISFTIAGDTYQAEEGMTWYEWVNSEYNTIGAYTSATNATDTGYSVYTPSNSAVYLNYISLNNSFVTSRQTITNNTAYIITVAGGGAGA